MFYSLDILDILDIILVINIILGTHEPNIIQILSIQKNIFYPNNGAYYFLEVFAMKNHQSGF